MCYLLVPSRLTVAQRLRHGIHGAWFTKRQLMMPSLYLLPTTPIPSFLKPRPRGLLISRLRISRRQTGYHWDIPSARRYLGCRREMSARRRGPTASGTHGVGDSRRRGPTASVSQPRVRSVCANHDRRPIGLPLSES